MDLDTTSVFLEYTVRDRKSQAGSSSDVFCGKKGVENVGYLLRINTFTGVADLDLHPFSIKGVRFRGELPPSGMAWMAFMKRFRNTCCKLL